MSQFRLSNPALRLRLRALLACLVPPMSALCAPGAHAQDQASTREGLPTVQVEALLTDPAQLQGWVRAHQPEVLAAAANVEQARALRRGSRLLQNPALQMNVGGMSLTQPRDPAVSYRDPISFSVGVQQTLEIGKRGPRGAAADLRAESAAESHADVLGQKVAEARDALAQLLHLSVRQTILEERAASARQVVELEGVRLAHGDISGTDYDRLRLDAASIERDAADNLALLSVANAQCATALAAQCKVQAGSAEDLDRGAPLPVALPDLAQSAARQPAVKALALEHDASTQDARYWQHHAIPDPTVGVAYTRDFYRASGSQPHTIGLFASIPLPFFDSGSSQADAARAAAMQAQEQSRAVQTRLTDDARGLLSRKDSLERKLKLIDGDLLPLSKSVVQSAERAFNQGQLSLTDYLIARREHSALLLDQVDTRYDLFNVRNELRRALGLDVQLAAR